MTYYVDSIEPFGLPVRRTVSLEEGQEISLWALQLSPDGGRGLRRTVFRGAEDNPPAGAQVVFWARATQDGLTVTDTGRGVHTELIRPDHRSQVVAGMRLPQAANLELTLPDESRVQLTVALRRQLAQGADVGIAGGGTKRSRVVYGADNVWWLITDTKGIVVTLGINAWDAVRDRMMSMGVDSRVLSFVGGIVLATVGGALASYWQYQRAEEATERAEGSETALARAEAAQKAALATEMACLSQRKDLVGKLGQIEAQHALAAEMALSFGLSNKVAVELGGDLLGSERLLEADGLLRPGLISAVVAKMGESQGDPAACLAQNAALSNDLPSFLLLYHPDPELSCPLDYSIVESNVDRRGRWGLSERIAREFGKVGNENTGTTAETLDDLLGDPRMEDRWSAFTLAIAYRDLTERLLRGGPGDRASMLPSQAQLWSLAVFDAYNNMPSTPGGTLDAPMDQCLSRVLSDLADGGSPAAPGEALLPDIVAVALGDAEVSASPTPGCPWPRDALANGANNALRAVGRLAAYQLETTQE